MEGEKKTSSILKKLEKYVSIKSKRGIFTKSRSWHISSTTSKANDQKHHQAAGCFSVYVGPEKQRFVIKAEFANHPLFKMLLEDAELEYGFSEGPLQLPCEVDLFCKVLAQMDDKDQFDDDHGFGYGYGSSCSPFSPRRSLGKSSSSRVKGYSSYALLTPPRLLKINNFG